MRQYDIERYLNVRNAGGADLGPDGRLSFLLDTTGTGQVWSVREPESWPEQHTFFEESVSFVDSSPERSEAVFGMDEGGNERAQLYRLDYESGAITNLTDMPEAKHRWGGWDSTGDRFAFASNRRDEAVFDVYVQGRDETGDDAELVYEGDGWLSVAGWSPSDDRLIVHEAHSSFDHDVYTLDLATGDLTHHTPHEGDVRYSGPEWGPDGEGVYLVTDRDTDTLRLERLDLETDEFAVVADGGEWNVDGVAIDDESRRVVYSRNVDGYTELTAGELVAPDRIDEFPDPDLPDGVAGGVSFGPDGDRFAVTATGSTHNANVYVVEATTGEAERWTRASTAGIPADTFVERELVHYPTFDGREIPAFFSVPETEPPESGYPVVVDIHGGPESQRRPSFASVTQYLLNNGYAVFEPNVRGSSGYGKAYSGLDDVENRMDSVKDVREAVGWLHDHPEVDPDRVVAMGGSYGGFMVLASLTEYPELWAAGVDIVGIANFVTFLENTGDWRRSLREAEYGSLEADREFLESVSPINNIESIEAPLFVLHGENDPRVPVGEAEQIVEEAREQGVPVRKLIFDDEGHGFAKLDNRIEAYREIVGFLAEHV
ncbi:peptidase S9 prolyl oligopeptidase active site domain protein [Halorubrum distributum JCM 9100]|uniref:Acyl-peptide hydrolase n=2 Tax=Halorubrum distributum TaxID=29283 RepID=M0ER75_9EURY|nr:S9 family peptidase [Halorubrum distributum]ELZ50311.1 peptidase S9 prolyl oligopeptidase active site domain protein [Halorubrum distributum JCM 9100]ELZ53628.1 peptidase S9 prolyl oligopeptidase active site domain protein [Halorubrum distributum JCM 10118]